MKLFNIELGNSAVYEKFKYPGGEMQIRLTQSALALTKQAERLVITARVKSAEDIVELAMLCSALRYDDSKRHINVVLPYLPYARADRRFVDGDCFGLEVFANLLNALHVSVFTLDAHSAKSADLIERLIDLPPDIFMDKTIQELSLSGEPLTLLFPDDGARKRYARVAANSQIDILHCAKVRDKKSGRLSGFSVPAVHEFKSRNVLLVDDICDGGGTFLGIANSLSEYKLNLNLYVTHGIFSKGLEPLLKLFGKIFTTDSVVSHSGSGDPSKVVVYPTSPYIEECIAQREASPAAVLS